MSMEEMEKKIELLLSIQVKHTDLMKSLSNRLDVQRAMIVAIETIVRKGI